MTTFSMSRTVSTSYEDTLKRVPEALKAEGFGVLTEIDVKGTLKKKIGADFRRYRILGACNPPLALQALQAEIEVGVMLPCNLIVYEGDDGKTHVAAIDPEKTMAALGNPKLLSIAKTVRAKLAKVVENL